MSVLESIPDQSDNLSVRRGVRGPGPKLAGGGGPGYPPVGRIGYAVPDCAQLVPVGFPLGDDSPEIHPPRRTEKRPAMLLDGEELVEGPRVLRQQRPQQLLPPRQRLASEVLSVQPKQIE